jgi:hypothetical protein
MNSSGRKAVTLVTFFIISFWGCIQKEKSATLILDYCYSSGWINSYSIKIYSTGHGYLNKNNLKTDSLFTTSRINIDSLSYLIDKIASSHVSDKYVQTNLQDGASFTAIIYSESGVAKKYHVYGDKFPDVLHKLKKFAYKLSTNNDWHFLNDTVINFASVIKLPQIKLDSNVRFLPPSKEK